jgi:hypothetical protein
VPKDLVSGDDKIVLGTARNKAETDNGDDRTVAGGQIFKVSVILVVYAELLAKAHTRQKFILGPLEAMKRPLATGLVHFVCALLLASGLMNLQIVIRRQRILSLTGIG